MRKRGLFYERGTYDAVYYLLFDGNRRPGIFNVSDRAGDQGAARPAAGTDQRGGSGSIPDPVPVGGGYCVPVFKDCDHLVLCFCILYCGLYRLSGGNRRMGAGIGDVVQNKV